MTLNETWDTAACDRGYCPQHEQCGPGAFCCVTGKHAGCDPVWDLKDVDEVGWA